MISQQSVKFWNTITPLLPMIRKEHGQMVGDGITDASAIASRLEDLPLLYQEIITKAQSQYLK